MKEASGSSKKECPKCKKFPCKCEKPKYKDGGIVKKEQFGKLKEMLKNKSC